MESRVLTLFTLVIVASGCMHSSPPLSGMTPEEKYSELVSRSRNATYHVEYNVTFETGGSNMMSGVLNSADVHLYSYRGDLKSRVTISVLGSAVVTSDYPIKGGNASIQCQKITSLTSGSGLKCSVKYSQTSQLMATGPSSSYRDQLEKINVSAGHIKTIAGRECMQFDVTIPEEVINVSAVEGPSHAGMCVDMEKGYMARMAVNMTMRSGLGRTTDIRLAFEATDYSPEVSESRVKIPRDLVVGLRCKDGLKVDIYSADYSGPLNITVNDGAESSTIESGELRTFNYTEHMVDGTNSVNVTAGGRTYSGRCKNLEAGLDL
ncbi:MAG: hypothetical protein ABEK01_05895 [Candidatus Nanohaloarchaea archaeon]